MKTTSSLRLITFSLTFLIGIACHGQKMDLIIKNATVFDSKTGSLLPKQTILIKDGIIVSLDRDLKKRYSSNTIDAKGKLITAGFIDTHIHPSDVYRSYGPLPEFLPKDSLQLFRQRITDTFLPYGVTTAMIMGHSENWLTPILSWQNSPRPDQLNLYTVGGALVSDQARRPYINHVIVNSPQAATKKVIDNHKAGLKAIKLYWKLRRPEFQAALHAADSLKIRVFGHVDQNVMSIDTALMLGLRHYEHALTLVNTAYGPQADGPYFNQSMQTQYGPGHAGAQLERLEMFRYIHEKNPEKLNALISSLANYKATLSTGIHLMAEPYGLSYFSNQLDTTLTPAQLDRCKENFRIFMRYLKQCLDKGVMLRIGTDWPQGGKAYMSEQLLLSQYGFSTADILKISTLNGAAALGLDSNYGSIEKGKKADLLIWEQSPFQDTKNFLAHKMIIKDGKIYQK